MTAKTFRATSTQAAFEQIQQELGPEAIIVSVRQVPSGPAWQTWKRPEVEVLAIPGSDPKAALPEIEIVAPVHEVPAYPSDRLPHTTKATAGSPGTTRQAQAPSRTEIEALLLALAARSTPKEKSAASARTIATNPTRPAVQVSVQKTTQAAPETQLSRAQQKTKSQLLTQGVDPEMTNRLVDNCALSLSASALEDEGRVRTHVRSQMEAHLRVQKIEALFGPTSLANRVIFLVGPSGSGKTSTCAKLASFAARSMNKKVAWVSADTFRAGAIGLARTYTEPLGIQLRLAYTPQELNQMVAEASEADLILVDTPACNPRMESELVELGALLTAVVDRSTFLVAPAVTKEGDLQGMTSAFGAYHLNGLVFTKLDETNTFGSLYNLASRTQLPISIFTSGPRVLGDLQMAQPKTLTGLIFGERINKTGA
jgi:flagellar biosynthesis protein FlhF